jgi:hypothetical protein
MANQASLETNPDEASEIKLASVENAFIERLTTYMKKHKLEEIHPEEIYDFLNEENGALGELPTKRIFFIFIKLLAQNKIPDIGSAALLGYTASGVRCGIAKSLGAKEHTLCQLEKTLLLKRLLEGGRRTPNKAEENLTRFARDAGASIQEIEAMKDRISKITWEEITEVTGFTPDETIPAHSGPIQ